MVEGSELEAINAELLEALKWFLEDERFQVAVGGNPHAVEKMLTDARAVIAKAEGEGMSTKEKSTNECPVCYHPIIGAVEEWGQQSWVGI